MRTRSTPGYKALFGGTAKLETLLEGIPSVTVIKIISFLNAQFLSSGASLKRDQELRIEFTQTLSKDEVAKLYYRLHSECGENAIVFWSVYLTYFLHYELTHFRNITECKIDGHVKLQIFKAYLVVADLYNELDKFPVVDISLPDEVYFSQMVWPMLFKQYEFNRDVDAILTLTRLYLLMDTLEKSTYSRFATTYCKRFGCDDGFNLVRIFLSIIGVSNKSNDGINRVYRVEKTPSETWPLLDSLVHPTSHEATSWAPISLESLKQFPLFKSAEGEYHILNWNFFYRSVYEAIIRDFYHTSGIADAFPNYGNFKGWVGLEVTEKRLLRGILQMMYKDNPEQLIFPDAKNAEKPDAYLRQGRYVVAIECKDTDVSEVNQSEFDYTNFLQELNKKHVKNEQGQPKTVYQLARNAAEIMSGRYPKELYATYRAKDLWVLPVLVCDGYLFTAPGVNELLNQHYETARTVKTGRLAVVTIEYLFRKITDLQGQGLAAILLGYSSECGKRRKRFQKAPSAELALETYPSLEEVYEIDQLPYKAQRGFLVEFYNTLGLALAT